eukprot:12429858-Alexandrium_andersonii.AAC.1
MCAPNAHPPACGTPGMQAPGKVSVHINSQGDPVVLPRKTVDAPWAHDQAPRQPGQRRPVRGGG